MVLGMVSGQMSRVRKRVAAAVAAVILVMGGALVWALPASAAEQSIPVSASAYGVTASGSVTYDCSTGEGLYNLSVTNTDKLPDDSVVEHVLRLYVDGSPILNTSIVAESTPINYSFGFDNTPGVTTSVAIYFDLDADPSWTGSFVCIDGTINSMNVGYDDSGASEFFNVSGTASVAGVAEGDVMVVFSSPDGLVLPNAYLSGGAFTSSVDVTGMAGGAYEVTAQLMYGGAPLGAPYTAIGTIPEPTTEPTPTPTTPELPTTDPEPDPEPSESAAPPVTVDTDSGATDNSSGDSSNADSLPGAANTGGELPTKWLGVPVLGYGLFATAAVLAVLAIWPRRRASKGA
jgi:hypothetical protein